MPIREPSFRIGCGRYLQAPHLLERCGDEVRRLGQSPLVVGGPKALAAARPAIEESLAKVCARYRFSEHSGTCNDEDAARLADLAKDEGYDVIVGVGGGVIMDFAKLIGEQAACPVLNVPTSSATCAAYTPLSVRYTPDGRTVGSRHYGYEVDGVLVDTALLAAQPPRLFLAGIFDALAKHVEITQRLRESREIPLGLDWAAVLAEKSFSDLIRNTETCLGDMEAGRVTQTFEHTVFTAIAATGVISGIARGSNQTALAHKFYESTRTLFFEASRPYLHGEIVGVGLLLQNHFNGEAEHNGFLLSVMDRYHMPRRLSDIGVPATDETLAKYEQAIRQTSAVDANDPEQIKKLREGLAYLRTLEEK